MVACGLGGLFFGLFLAQKHQQTWLWGGAFASGVGLLLLVIVLVASFRTPVRPGVYAGANVRVEDCVQEPVGDSSLLQWTARVTFVTGSTTTVLSLGPCFPSDVGYISHAGYFVRAVHGYHYPHYYGWYGGGYLLFLFFFFLGSLGFCFFFLSNEDDVFSSSSSAQKDPLLPVEREMSNLRDQEEGV